MDIKILATGSSGNCYHVSDGTTEILIECGIKYSEIVKKLDYNMGNINTVFISHAHKDHAEAAKLMATYGFDLVMPPETAVTLGLDKEPNVFTPAPGKQILVNTLIVIPFSLVHFNSDGSDCPCYGYFIASKTTQEKLVFATDTAYIKNTFKAVDYMLIEVNYMASMIDGGETEDFVSEVEKRRLKSHMSLETAVEFLEKSDRSKLKTLYAIHGSSKRLDKDEAYRILEPYAERVIIP